MNNVAHCPVSVQHKAKQTATRTTENSQLFRYVSFFMTELSFRGLVFFIANLLKIRREKKVLFVG